MKKFKENIPEILIITSYPPRECGIATYSQDLISSLNHKFGDSFNVQVCALESEKASYQYGAEVKFVLDTSDAQSYIDNAIIINNNEQIQLVLIQHEFGFFNKQEAAFLNFLREITKPVIVVFHTVLPNPVELLKKNVKEIANSCDALVVMTKNAKNLLTSDYTIPEAKITVIAHGTHLVPHLSKKVLKNKYGLTGKKVLTTFGLLSSGKSIETTLYALPEIIKEIPDVMFLIIGKTHPEVVKNDGESYREMLQTTVSELGIEHNVRFINSYLALPELLEYLQLTDIYLFTTNDPNQAVSGTFVYAMSCGCPIISTPIPHALEVLKKDTGIIIDFQDSVQLAENVVLLLHDERLRKNISTNTLQKIVFTAWENSAVAHAKLITRLIRTDITLSYKLPEIKMEHLEKMTTNFGLIQFSKINQPDAKTGYTLDDNARAMVAVCMHYELTFDKMDFLAIHTYLDFIKYCQQPSGSFLNYVDIHEDFTVQNNAVNLDDANGRAIWALGFLISKKSILPEDLITTAISILLKCMPGLETIHSTRALAFIIKGLYFYDNAFSSIENILLIKRLANRMMLMYEHESSKDWEWFESYLTYANSILPEAMLYASIVTGNERYRNIAKESFDFLLSVIFNENGIRVVSNKSSYKRGGEAGVFGEQPIDVAYTILTLSEFYKEFNEEEYLDKLKIAFNWFLGENRLNQIIYNPCTGGCYDGLEEYNVNLNQGAESTVSYLMARFTMEKYQEYVNNTTLSEKCVTNKKPTPITFIEESKMTF